MNFFFFQSPAKNLKDKTTKHLLLQIYESPHNMNDGLEFRDDAIRTKDQPLLYTMENVSPRTSNLVCSSENIYQ